MGVIALLIAAALWPAPAQLEHLALRLRLVEEINRDRRVAGLPPVEYSEELSRAADEHCREMLAGDYTSHWNRSGWKPYLRYSQAGNRASTSENVWSMRNTDFAATPESLEVRLLEGHRTFMAEQPPEDGHRRSVLDPQQTHVGIGIAYDRTGLRLIEVFGAQHAALEPLPGRATLRLRPMVRGRLLKRDTVLVSIAVFYEPLPQPLTREQLAQTRSYGLPEEERVERPVVTAGSYYADGTRGTIEVEPSGKFWVPLTFWKRQPGVYTVGVWVRRGRGRAFLGAMASVLVEE